ncbi:cadherin EGF LAG seven-pass G-type receptor 1-like [Dendronephthya gigantea]|uniref:cadherin EGF LAG seven-pass G-type receptor 1-like n=1 Tax=Dendronephthya gigantea TaxID=151771 RepID=UPI001068EAE9|nr:cadherin EGF LAG seven-pass G-type receptor 1-like [Dendronephthya gigantea]
MFINIVLDRLPGELGKKFVLKCAIVAWVLPMLIVVITVLVSTDDYKNDQYCRVQGKSFYIAFLAPAITVLVFNVIIFALVVKALQSTRIRGNRHKQGIVHFRRVLGIAIVFGITWLFGVLAIGELRLIFQYLFCITNSFQGFMIFILYCLTDRKVRERLVRFLCALPDPNHNRIIDSSSTQRPTDIDINLSMFETQPSTRPRNWSGTWPISGHTNLARVTPEELTVYPRPNRSDYIPDFLHESGYSSNMVDSNFHPRPRYHPHPVSSDYDPNRVWEYEHDEFELPYTYRNPPGSQPVTNIPLPGEVSGDALVDSTLAQYLERSGGDISLKSGNSVIFINDGQRVVVPEYPELAGSNNKCDDKKVDPLQVTKTYDSDEPGIPEGPRRYNQGGDGLSFYKKPRPQRHSSATTSAELDKRFYPKGRVHSNKAVHFSADQLATSPRESERWSDVGDVPRLKTHSRPEDISEVNEHQARGKYKPRRTKSAQPLRRVIADDEVEEEYYRDYRKKFDKEHDEVTSNFIAASESKNSKDKPACDRKREGQFGQESGSSSSDTSSDTSFRWIEATEAGHAPNLKSYSLTTFSDFTSDDGLDDDGTHFTQF